MPLIGGGGAGNVVGGNPSGTGSSINFLRYPEKTLAYAYSGSITITGTDQIAIDFTTGDETIDAKISAQYLHASADGDDSLMKINLNSQQIGGNQVGGNFGGANPAMGPENWIPIIIPPYSHFQVTLTMLSGSGSIDLGVTLVGEVYA